MGVAKGHALKSIHVERFTFNKRGIGITRHALQVTDKTFLFLPLLPAREGMTTKVSPPLLLLPPHGGAALPRRLRHHAAGQARAGCVRCSVQPSPSPPLPSCKPVSRRAAAAALLVFHCCSSTNRADAGPFDKYLKRKKLDPLETYVPAVLLSEEQFKDLEKYLDLEKPEYIVSRSLLRSGPAASLRINIRAVAQYASEDGRGKVASDAVDRCLRALEDLDSLLLRASRNDPGASVQMMRQNINVALVALDSLLQTVPSSVLEKGKLIADAYRTQVEPQEESKAEELDKDVKELETIL